MPIHHSPKSGFAAPILFVALTGVVFGLASGRLGLAEGPKEMGAVFGTVSADRGVVRGFQVKAKDPAHRITYTVFTRAGRYQIPNLPPSQYEILVSEKGFESPVKEVAVKAGDHKQVDLMLKAKGPEVNKTELLDYDVLYPPGPDRNVLEMTCMGCHGKVTYHQIRTSEVGWRSMVEFMTTPNSPLTYNGVPALEVLPPEKKEAIVRYLAQNFGPNAPARDLKLDAMQVEEDTVADSMFIEYDLPEPLPNTVFNPRRAAPLRRATGIDATAQRRVTHDPFVSPDGEVWFTDRGGNSIIGLDAREIDFAKRFKVHPIQSSTWVYAHGIAANQAGHVYWSELGTGYLGELDPQSGEMSRYKIPTPGGPHSVAIDPTGDVWYSILFGSKLGKLDAKTHQFRQWDTPTPHSGLYGIIVDKKGNVWSAGLAKHMVIKFDPVSEKFTEYRTPSQPSGPRRLAMDSKGKIWFSEYMANSLGYLDPDTGQMIEYKFPLRYTSPYPVWSDAEDNIWAGDNVYNALIKFDQKTKRFTYYPLPQRNANPPHLAADKEGTLWFGSRNDDPKVIALKPHGNIEGKIFGR